MDAFPIKLTTGETLAVIFLDINKTDVKLEDVRKQMDEEIDELLPSSYHFFMSKWRVNISYFQESKILLKDVLDDGSIVIQPRAPERNALSTSPGERSVSNTSPDEIQELSTSPDLIHERSTSPDLIRAWSTWSTDEIHESFTSPEETNSNSPGKEPSTLDPGTSACKGKKRQHTLTSYFGATTPPEKKCATASTRRGVHTYTEKEIRECSGLEKERRAFWNKTAEEVCNDPKYSRCKQDQLDKLLHEKWRSHKAELYIKEDQEVRNELERILKKHPDLESSIHGRRLKRETISRNLVRTEKAKQAMERSRAALEHLYEKASKENTKEIMKQIKDKEELHKLNYRELVKAEDALRQSMEIRKRFLKELMEK